MIVKQWIVIVTDPSWPSITTGCIVERAADSRPIYGSRIESQADNPARVLIHHDHDSVSLRSGTNKLTQPNWWTRQMNTYKRHRFPPENIIYAVWLHYRFNLSHSDIEDLLAERGIIVSREAICLWCIKFGALFGRGLKRKRRGFGENFYIDDVFVKINGKPQYLLRAVDQNDEVVDEYLQARRDGTAVTRLPESRDRDCIGLDELICQYQNKNSRPTGTQRQACRVKLMNGVFKIQRL